MTNYSDEFVQRVIENSFRNFHAKGLDYICLHRSPALTVKIYFLDGDVTKIPEVVNPHDHRYPFKTMVLAGAMADHRFKPDPTGEVFQAFDYMTPLNGGSGFTYRGEERMSLVDGGSIVLPRGAELSTPDDAVHTIEMLKDQTVLCLYQFADVVPIDKPTSTWVRKGDPEPNTSGLYDRFTEDQIMSRFKQLSDLDYAVIEEMVA